MPSSSPWHVLVIGNGNYDEAIGALPGAIEDAEKFAKEVPQRLGDDQPIVLLNGSADEHYRRIDDWLQAESSKKMMFCAGHGMRCQGIFYIKTTKNEDIPVQEYVRRKVDHLGKRDVVVACFFGTCQVHTESSGNLQNPHFPGLSAKHHFTGLNNLFAFSFNSEPGKYVVDYSNVYARVLIDMLSCGGYRSLQEVLETLPDLVSNESSFTERPWKEDNLGNSSASFGEDTEDSSDLSEPSALCALSPQSLSGDSGVQIIPSSQTKPAPDQLMTLTGDMTILHRADSVIGECMWKLDRVDFKGCNSHARDATLQRAAQYSVELCKAMHDLRFLVLPGTTDSQIYPTLPKRLTLLQKYVQGLDLVLRNGQLKWHGWHSFSAEIHRVFDDQSAAAVYENLITYASTLYHCQLRRIVVEQAGLDHEILLEIEQCLRVAAEGFVAQSREILPGPISKHQVFVALHSWVVAQRWLGKHSECQAILVDWFGPLLALATEEIQEVWKGRRSEAQKYQLLQQLQKRGIDHPTCYEDVASFLYKATRWYEELSQEALFLDFTLHMELNEWLTWQPQGWQLCTAVRGCLHNSGNSHLRALVKSCLPLCTAWGRILQKQQHQKSVICQKISVSLESGTELALRKYAQEVGRVMLAVQRWFFDTFWCRQLPWTL